MKWNNPRLLVGLTPLEPWITRKIDHADLAEYQFRKLRDTLCLAREKSRFYRRQLADASIDLTSLDDLTRRPFTTADDLRADPLAFGCVSQDAIQRVVTLDDANFPLTTLTTSGTTGQPKHLYFTREDQALTIDFFHIGMSTFTAPGDRVLILLPGETPASAPQVHTAHDRSRAERHQTRHRRTFCLSGIQSLWYAGDGLRRRRRL